MAKRVTSARHDFERKAAKAGGGGGGAAGLVANIPEGEVKQVKQASQTKKDINSLRSRLEQPSMVTRIPEESDQKNAMMEEYFSRIRKLDQTFHDVRSFRRRGKRIDIDVIDDNRITPSERIELFVKAATQEGYNQKDALEFAINRLEEKGEDVAGAGNNPNR